MTTAPTIIGIDLGKHWFHLIGMDERGATVLRKKLNRGQLAERRRGDGSVYGLAVLGPRLCEGGPPPLDAAGPS